MKDRIEEILSIPLSEIKKNPKILKKFYKEFFQEDVCSTCPGVIEAKYHALRNITEERIERISTNILRMRKGALIDTYMASAGPIGHFTNANITDEVAIELIERGWVSAFDNPNDIQKAIDTVYSGSKTKPPLVWPISEKEKQSNQDTLDKAKTIFTTEVK